MASRLDKYRLPGNGILPWIGIAAMGYLGWILSLVVGFVSYQIALSFCPEDQMESGICMAPWFDVVERSIELGTIGLSAFFVVLFSVLAASTSRKPLASVLSFLVGASFAVWLVIDLSSHERDFLWLELMIALVSGFLTMAYFLHRYKSSSVAD